MSRCLKATSSCPIGTRPGQTPSMVYPIASDRRELDDRLQLGQRVKRSTPFIVIRPGAATAPVAWSEKLSRRMMQSSQQSMMRVSVVTQMTPNHGPGAREESSSQAMTGKRAHAGWPRDGCRDRKGEQTFGRTDPENSREALAHDHDDRDRADAEIQAPVVQCIVRLS